MAEEQPNQRDLGGHSVLILDEDVERPQGQDAQSMNISAGQTVAEAVCTTLGPPGMDKMLVSSSGDVVITNDGVTILDEMDIEHLAADMIVEVAEAQEDETGDGTTTAVVIAGELLDQAEGLLEQSIHPQMIVRGYLDAASYAHEQLVANAIDVDATTFSIVIVPLGSGIEMDRFRGASRVEGNRVLPGEQRVQRSRGWMVFRSFASARRAASSRSSATSSSSAS